MEVVEQPEWIEPVNAGALALLPVYPPDVSAIILKRMNEIVKISVYKLGIRKVKSHGVLVRGIHAHLLCDCLIGILKALNTVSGMQVTCMRSISTGSKSAAESVMIRIMTSSE